MTLIEKLTKGDVYVKNDCTPEEMLTILKAAFPESESNDITHIEWMFEKKDVCMGIDYEYSYEWLQYYDDEPEYEKAISAKEFLKELNIKNKDNGN